MTLRERLREIRLAFEGSSTPREDIQVLDQHVEHLRDTDRIHQAIQVGAQAPPFSLESTSGRTIDLGELLPNGPVVLTWFRGNW